jgi:hypothetical protein
MSWSGTVTCSYCYNRGHNRRKCPDLAAAYLTAFRRFQAEIDAGDVSSVAMRDNRRDKYEKMTKLDAYTGLPLKRKKTAGRHLKTMTCSYCNYQGHTRRTCQNLKNDYEIYKFKTVKARKEFLSEYESLAMGIGSLVRINTNNRGQSGQLEYARREMVGILTGILWNEVGAFNQPTETKVFVTKTCHEMAGRTAGWRDGIALFSIEEANRALRGERTAQQHVISVSGSAATPPADWLQTFEDLKSIFDPKEARGYIYYSTSSHASNSGVDQARKTLGLKLNAYHDDISVG